VLSEVPDVIVLELDLTRVTTRSHLEPERLSRLGYRLRAPHRPGGSIEGREEPVAGRAGAATTEPLDLPTCELIVTREKCLPWDRRR
jgi:hypothetical protein